jgi:predicted enzyme related to lactoylglutathione lyase
MENQMKILLKASGIALLIMALVGCASSPKHNMNNPIFYCEIPVKDIDRAMAFYSMVFEFELEKQSIDGNEMALFPYTAGVEGATGALAQGDSYKPSLDGSRIYFSTLDIDSTLGRVTKGGGKILYPKTDVGDYGFVAEFEDSEGNRIALHMKKN